MPLTSFAPCSNLPFWSPLSSLSAQRMRSVGARREVGARGRRSPRTPLSTAPLSVRPPWTRSIPKPQQLIRRATPPPLSKPDREQGWKRRPQPSAKQTWTLRPLPGTFSVKENSEESGGSGEERRRQSGFETRSQGGRGELAPQELPRRRPGEPRGLRELPAVMGESAMGRPGAG
ncbi:hypothetical protein H8959_016325 [Pygathrix nigripes]